MNTGKHQTGAFSDDQVFRFLIKGGSVPRATVTILAEDMEIALRRVHALFPGSDHSEIEPQPAERYWF